MLNTEGRVVERVSRFRGPRISQFRMPTARVASIQIADLTRTIGTIPATVWDCRKNLRQTEIELYLGELTYFRITA